MKTIAVVPARSGSQGLPGKNLRLVAGRSLVERAIEFGLALALDDVVFSSDSADYCAVARGAGATVLDLRSAEAANATAMEEDVIDDLNHQFRVHDYALPDAVVWIRPTFVFRSLSATNACIADIQAGRCTAARVVTEVDPRLYERGPNGFLSARFDDGGVSMMRRQGLEPLYRVFNVDVFLWPSGPCPRDFLGDRVTFHVAPKICGLDIDDHEDLSIAEAAVNGRQGVSIL